MGLLEAYFSEYLKEYLSLITNLDPAGIHPNIIEDLIVNTTELMNAEAFESNSNNIEQAIISLQDKYQKIVTKLDGEKTRTSIEEITFPILEKGNDGKTNFGFIERISISVKSKHGIEKDKFIIVPSFGKLESKLNRQIITSWEYAKQIILKSKKSKNVFYEVVIQFDKKYGVYEGDSLGIALTIGFIQVLVNYHNLRELVKIKGSIVSTGSVNEQGIVGNISREIINKKLEIVFFSEADIFIVSEKDKQFADEHLLTLKKDFPKRELTIVAVASIEDLINRRNLVEVKKQNVVKWAAKKTYNNKLAFAAVLLLIIISSYFFVKDIDNNPVDIEFKNSRAYAKNKYGKVLWDIFPAINNIEVKFNSKFHKKYFKMDAADNLNKSSIYICGINKSRDLFKLDYAGNEIWSYKFRSKIESDSEVFSNEHQFHTVVGIFEKTDYKEVVAITQHASYYPNAVIKLNAKTREITDSIFWHPGGIAGSRIEDIDNDGNLEFVGLAISNGYKCVAYFSIEYDKLIGTAPAPKGYRFKNQSIADFEWYILIPLSDYGKHHYPKYNHVIYPPSNLKKEKYISVSTVESGLLVDKRPQSIQYNFPLNLNGVEIVIDDSFAIDRDKLVDAGILEKPYSDTREYREILKRQLQKWNGKEFVQMFPDTIFTD